MILNCILLCVYNEKYLNPKGADSLWLNFWKDSADSTRDARKAEKYIPSILFAKQSVMAYYSLRAMMINLYFSGVVGIR